MYHSQDALISPPFVMGLETGIQPSEPMRQQPNKQLIVQQRIIVYACPPAIEHAKIELQMCI